jgi:hypothetical protein
MKATIDVSDRKEADAIRAGLEIEEVRAMVVIVGTLTRLPDDRTRQRVLNFVIDKLAIAT